MQPSTSAEGWSRRIKRGFVRGWRASTVPERIDEDGEKKQRDEGAEGYEDPIGKGVGWGGAGARNCRRSVSEGLVCRGVVGERDVRGGLVGDEVVGGDVVVDEYIRGGSIFKIGIEKFIIMSGYWGEVGGEQYMTSDGCGHVGRIECGVHGGGKRARRGGSEEGEEDGEHLEVHRGF